MQAIQTQSPAFDFLPTVAPPRTLGDLRMGQNNYANASSFSAKSMRPLLIVGILIAVGAGIAWGVNAYPKYSAAKVDTASSSPAPTVPAASSLPATANDSPVTTPLSPLTKSEVSSMPSAGPENNRSSESIKPVKAKHSVVAKSASVPAKKVAPMPASPVDEIAPAPEAAPPSPPAPIIIEEKPVAPPAEPAPQ